MENQKESPMNHKIRLLCTGGLLGLASLSLVFSIPSQEPETPPPSSLFLNDLKNHINNSWTELERNAKVCYRDNLEEVQEESCLLYIPKHEELAQFAEKNSQKNLKIARLEEEYPEKPGRLYLPYPYIVPGGRFNEMYGWDSFFIQLGLLNSGKKDAAKGLVENLLYEIEHYGKVLNANHSYFLSRSHPPFVSSMVLLQYEQNKDPFWLKKCFAPLEKYHNFWCSPPRMTEITGLSRYFDPIAKPAPEVLTSEVDAMGRTHYERVKNHLAEQNIPANDLAVLFDSEKEEPTDQFYIRDRSMRESGFDPSFVFGPFNLDIIEYNPVCLNCLLFKMEEDLAKICLELDDQPGYIKWKSLANERREKINRFLWDEEHGLFLNYHVEKQQTNPYLFGTIFYPLWTKVATAAQAERIVSHLPYLERNGGLMASMHYSGCQWDAPFGWAPLQWIAVQGLKNYRYEMEAARISKAFLSLVLKEFARTGKIFEKYDVENCSSEASPHLRFGYQTNEEGFGWTNGVFLDLLKDCSLDELSELNDAIQLQMQFTP
jgi:alpha,alpha-trehalase